MNILFLSDNFPPEVNAPAHRTLEHCREWVRQGARVTVITCAPNFPRGKVYPGYRNRLYQTEYIDGIRVLRVWTYIAPNAGRIKRILDYFSFAVAAVVASFWQRPDIIVATSPQFFTALAGYMVARLKRRPWIMEVRDLWPESIRAVGAMYRRSLLDRLEWLERFLYRRADALVVVTESFRENMIQRGIDPDKIHVIKNGVDLGIYHPRPRDRQLEAALGLEGKFVVGYLGTHGMAHKLDFILACAAATPQPDIHYLFIGDGAERKRLLQLKEQLGLQNVTMLDSVPRSEVVRYLSLLDVSLVPLMRSNTFKKVIPSKIFENAAMEKPILLGVEGESAALIHAYGAGLCFEPENQADFLQQLARLYAEEALYIDCQAGCRRLARDFDRRELAGKMFELLALTARMDLSDKPPVDTPNWVRTNS